MTVHYQELINEFAKTNVPGMVDEDDLVNQVAMQMARNNQVHFSFLISMINQPVF